MFARFLVLVVMLAAAPAHADDVHYRPLSVSLFGPAALFGGKDTVVVGPSVNLIYGHHRAVYGLEVGLVNNVDKAVGPLQIGAFVNAGDGACYGLCVAGFANVHGGLVGAQASILGNEAGEIPLGLQVGLFNVIRSEADLAVQVGVANINNRRLADLMAAMGAKKGDIITIHIHGGTQRGLQLGFVNMSDDYRGLQVGFFNGAEKGKGIQLGGFNVSSEYSGMQVGIWNHATRMHGIQLGAINTARSLKGVQIGAINIATANTLPVTVLINAGF